MTGRRDPHAERLKRSGELAFVSSKSLDSVTGSYVDHSIPVKRHYTRSNDN